MLALVLFLALSLPDAQLASFAERVAQSVSAAAHEAVPQPGSRAPVRVAVRVEDAAGVGAANQVTAALRDALRSQKLEAAEADSAFSVRVWIGRRGPRPLGVARILNAEGHEIAVIFGLFPPNDSAAATREARPAVEVRSRTLLSLDGPILDVKADSAGNLFVLQSDRLIIADLKGEADKQGLPMKAEIGIQTGAETLRDPVVRLLLKEQQRELELHTAASEVGPAPPVRLEGYVIRSFPASAALILAHPWRALSVQLQPLAGRNFFRAPAFGPLPGVQDVAPLPGAEAAAWVVLDVTGRLLLYDTAFHSLGEASGSASGGDVAAVSTSCAGTLVLAASNDPAPVRDSVSIFRLVSGHLEPMTTAEIDGAVRRLEPLAGEGAIGRILAVTESGGNGRIEEIELRCGQ